MLKLKVKLLLKVKRLLEVNLLLKVKRLPKAMPQLMVMLPWRMIPLLKIQLFKYTAADGEPVET